MTLDRARLVALAAVVIGIVAFAPTVRLDTGPTTIAEQRALAAQGDAGAQFGVGYSYWVGQRGLHEDAEAGRWFRRAADQGHADAQFTLGDMHHTERGVRQDGVEAHTWFSLAAQSFQDPEDRERSAEARDAVARQMTPEQIAAAQRRARRWTQDPRRDVIGAACVSPYGHLDT